MKTYFRIFPIKGEYFDVTTISKVDDDTIAGTTFKGNVVTEHLSNISSISHFLEYSPKKFVRTEISKYKL